jgi:hypothetical protein
VTITLTKLDGACFPRQCCGETYADARVLMDHLLDPKHP